MKRGHLSEYFRGIAAKTLSAVEANPARSHQHEFNGVSCLKAILGPEKKKIATRFIFLSDSTETPEAAVGYLTWYDARQNHATRSEYRLYFPTTSVSAQYKEGDLFVLGLLHDDTALCIVAERDSTSSNQVRWLFDIEESELSGFKVSNEDSFDRVSLEYASRLILAEIGLEAPASSGSAHLLDHILKRFGSTFPPTREFSRLVQELANIDPRENADDTLIAWMSLEEEAFRTLERHLISERLRAGFNSDGNVDVDGFISFSLGVQNRRKSRAGYALENHLETIFTTRNIRFSRTARTENNNRPDFLFPGADAYHDMQFPESRLTMLAAKTSAKDRWRQILGEADRIRTKHLVTLEPGISENQTNEMQARQVMLVLPRSIHDTYTTAQRTWIVDIEAFVCDVLGRQ